MRAPHPHFADYVPPRRHDRRLAHTPRPLWRRILQPGYRTVPWPIPDDWGREWQRRAYLRSIGIRPVGSPLVVLRDALVVAAACAILVGVLAGAARVVVWGHL